MKLRDALFKEPYRAFRVTEEHLDNPDAFQDWDREPLMGPTLAKEYGRGPFEGLFIVAGKFVTQEGALLDCYLDLVLPERICEHRFLQSNDQIVRSRGRRVGNGAAIPVIAIEKFGVPELFYAKANPSVGIEVLQKGLQLAREKRNVAYDLGVLLRKEKRYEEAIEAFSIFLAEDTEENITYMIYQERSELYKAIGQLDKAEEDKHLWAIAFAKRFGHPPSAQESF